MPFRHFLEKIGADLRALYVEFRCDDGYSTSLDMATALHPQTQLTLKLNDETLPRRNGYPMKLRVPTKLGFKNPKHITEIIVTNEYRDGFWRPMATTGSADCERSKWNRRQIRRARF